MAGRSAASSIGTPDSPGLRQISVLGGNLYCGTCGYSSLPAIYLGGAGTSTSNDQFKTGSNYSKGAEAYFGFPSYTAYSGTAFGNALPQVVHRNYAHRPWIQGCGYDVSKSFGLPNMKVLGENARLELRMDAFNVFNNLNFDPTSISNNIGCLPGSSGCSTTNPSNPNFGVANAVLAARVLSLTARFVF